MRPLSNTPLTHCHRPIAAAALSLLLTACSALPDAGSWGRSESQRAPVESRDRDSRPRPAATDLARGEAAIGPALASLEASADGVLLPEQTGYYMDVQHATLRKRFVNTDVTLAREGDQLRLVLPGGATFTSGSADVTESAGAMLRKVAEVLGEYDKTLVVVEGHSDATGAAGFNQALSEQRALAVARKLREHGVAGQRLVAVGYGPDRPVADNDTETGRARNRRIELLVRPVTGA